MGILKMSSKVIAVLMFVSFVFTGCFSSKSKEESSINNSGIEYVNFYDARAAFSDEVHTFFQQGEFLEVKEEVITYLNGMLEGITSNIRYYTDNKDNKMLNSYKEQEKRVKAVIDKVMGAKEKAEIKNAIHTEFRDTKELNIKYGTKK